MIDTAAATWKPMLECLAKEALVSILDGAAPLSVSLDVSFVFTDFVLFVLFVGSTDGRTEGSLDGNTLGSSDGDKLGSSDSRTEGSSDGKTLGSSDGSTDGSYDILELFFGCLVEGCLVEAKSSPLTGVDTTLEKFTFEPFLAATWAEIIRRIAERKSFEIIISVSSQLM
jgi:hypothetical protein